MNMTQHERALALAMYREELSDTNSDSGDWPAGVSSNLGQLDMKAEELIRLEWADIRVPRQRQLLSEIGGEVLLALQSDSERKNLRG